MIYLLAGVTVITVVCLALVICCSPQGQCYFLLLVSITGLTADGNRNFLACRIVSKCLFQTGHACHAAAIKLCDDVTFLQTCILCRASFTDISDINAFRDAVKL